jgi:cobalamin biosynthesis Mg chelatase CobN
VRITSIDPTGTIEQPQEVTATATQAPDVTTGDATDGGFAPADDGTGASADESGGNADDAAQAPAGEDTSSGGDDSGFPVLLIVAAAAVALIGAVTAVNIIRRTRANPPGGSPTAEGPPAGDPTAGSSPESAAAGRSSDTTSAG